jgi:hypothetical protein
MSVSLDIHETTEVRILKREYKKSNDSHDFTTYKIIVHNKGMKSGNYTEITLFAYEKIQLMENISKDVTPVDTK